MEQKQHLQQLLNEEQEPFVLNNFINERRYLRKRSHPGKAYDSRSGFPTIKRSKSGENPSFSDRFCLDLRSVCLSSSIESPSSPFILFLDSEHRRHSSVSTSIRNLLETELENSSLSTRRSSNRTTESLIHSFRRSLSIKKNSSSSSNLKKSSISSYNLFRSIIKRLIPSKSQSLIKIKPFTKQSSKSEFKNGDSKKFEGKGGSSGLGFYSSSNNSSAWSESDKSEIRSMDLDSSSSRSEDDGEFDRVAESRTETITSPSAKLATEICSNSDDPLGNCIWQPEFQSPVASPTRLKTEVEGSYQDKEQFSPVSVLEPPFEDDGFEQSFATVQRAKRLLLNKLCRFERLAGLDQLELEKRIAEEEEGEDEVEIAESLAREILNGSSCLCTCPVRAGMKKLVHDLIEEESGDNLGIDDSVKRIGQKIVDWKSVESHTIDMIVEMDLKRDDEKWRTVGDLVKETAIEIEIGIFGFLLEELSFDLSRSIGDGTVHVGHEDMGTL